MGRVIVTGAALPNTGVPGVIGGESARRVVRSPQEGVFSSEARLGQLIDQGDVFGWVDGEKGRLAVEAPLSGKIRGLIRPGTKVTKGHKIGDVDPRGEAVDHRLISDKARLVGRGVVEALASFDER